MADVNTNVINQAGTLLASMVSQITGKTALTPTTTGDFVSLANTALNFGLDPVCQAMSTVIGKTIFANRPYKAKLRTVEVTPQEYAWHNRKVSITDSAPGDSQVYNLTNGQSIDQQLVKVPNLLQLNIYGENAIQDYYTLFRQQVKMALSSPAELVEFLAMITQNTMDKVEQYKESFKRFALANFIGAKVHYNTGHVIKALTEYNTLTGLTLTATTVMQPANLLPFGQWLYARIMSVADAMTERTYNWHVNISGHDVARHTPYEMQRLIMFAPFDHILTNRVVSNTYNKDALERIQHESVNFWQSSTTPDTVNVTPGVLNPSTGAKTVPGSAINQADVLGVLFDRDALGVTFMEESFDPAPYNARGKYQTTWYSFTGRYYQDHTENGVVILLT